MIKSWFKKFIQYKFTFLLVPHGGGASRQVSIHLSFILFLFFTWTGITFWGSYLSAQHIDYWRTSLSNQVLKMKIQYLVTQLDHSQEYLDQVKTAEGQLRELLKYKSEASIIRSETLEDPASGGPGAIDQADINQSLESRDPDISWERLLEKVHLFKSEAKNRVKSYEDLSKWIDKKRQVYKATPRGWPCIGELSSHYGLRASPFDRGLQEYHPGIDISGTRGTPIRATADGTVRIASWKSGYGNLVVLQHDHGFSTRYGHNAKIVVRAGDKVKRGQILALMGDTGRASGVHCHYEVWHQGQRKNPYAFLRDDSGTATVSRPVTNTSPES